MPTLALRRSHTSTLVLQHDWAATPLGPIDRWPPALVTAVQACLNSLFPMCLAWGPELTQIYNDGYIPIVGGKHPAVFGGPIRDAWPEIWDFLEEQLRTVARTSEPLYYEDLLLPLTRRDAPEECYFTFSYSALHDEHGRPQGFLSVAYETTSSILSTRRQRTLTSLGLVIAAAPSVDEIWTRMQEAFDSTNPDAARAALYARDGDSPEARLVWSQGAAEPDDPWPPTVPSLDVPRAHRTHGIAARASQQRVHDVDGTRMMHMPLLGLDDVPLALLVVEPAPLVVADEAYHDWLLYAGLTVEGQVHRLQGLISHMDAVQSELSDAEARYRSLFENTQDGVLYSAPDGTIHGANPAACTILGFAETELIGGQRHDLFFPGDEELAAAVRLRRDAGQFAGELTFRRKDGSPIRVDLSSTIFIDTNSQERVVTIFRDVTERRRLEMRTQEMRRMDTLGQLTGGVAHDFNNLLTVILGAAESIEEGTSPEDTLTLAGAIRQAATQSAALTKQLLAFARRQPLHSLPTDLNALVAQLDALLRRALSESVSIALEPGHDVPLAQADPAQLEAAVLNLALNARDAMPSGGTLTIGTRERHVTDAEASGDLVAGHYVELFVRDTGTGMPPEVVGRAFEPFFTTKAPGLGTGLGLSMVYGFARQLDGSVSIESTVGQGTTVRLLLPRAAARPSKTGASPLEGVPRAKPGEVVLAVEDNDLLRKLVRTLLERLGYHVVTAGTAQEALDLLRSLGRVDLLFTDVVMPGGTDGRQLAQQVRRLWPEIGVLLTSGYMNPHTVAPLTAEQARERLLVKPYQLAPLARAVRGALDERTSRV